MNPDQYMRLALQLAAQASPSPNPRVGCVIVKSGRVIATGFHKKAGTAHAEVVALRKAGAKARGATLYVTLEPCCHYGQTPPCTDAIISSGISKVVAAMRDPDMRVQGKGFAALVHAGITVQYGILAKEAHDLNKHWIYFITHKKPYVIAKVAQTLDGKICTSTGESKWITGRAARDVVHRLRSSVDAVVVGINTILQDNPRLTAHGKGKDPLRVVLDSHLRITYHARVLKDSNYLILTTARKSKARLAKRIVVLPDLRWTTILNVLATRGITSLLIEGGSQTFTTAFEQNAINEVYWFIAPKLVGGALATTALMGRGLPLCRARKLYHMSVTAVGDDLCVHGILHSRYRI